ncbi:MAG: hypothetical protein RL326_1117, partial [Pseudomonadota bacterium]
MIPVYVWEGGALYPPVTRRDRNSSLRLGGQESLLSHRMSLGLKEIETRNAARTEPRP